MKGKSHPRPEPWPLTDEGHSAKDWRGGAGRLEVRVGRAVTWKASEASALGKRGDEGAPSCLWPC